MSEKKKVSLRGYTLGKRSIFSDLAWSGLARFSLGLAQFVSALNCLAIVILGICGCLIGDADYILFSLIATPVAFILQFAMLVVFARAADMTPE